MTTSSRSSSAPGARWFARPRARASAVPLRDGYPSPTTSIFRVLVTLAVAMALAIVLDARGIIHAANGMDDGPEKTATLAVGNLALRVAQSAHLTWPWDDLQAALGRTPQPSVAPLLSSVPAAPPIPIHHAARHVFAPIPVRPLPPRHQPARRPSTAGAPIPWVRPTHRPTRKYPFRLLVAGDSLVGYLGPELIDEVSHMVPVRGFVDSHNGTGLTRPDFVDWSIVARQEVGSDNPDATVVMMGGNDFQNMTLPGGKVFLAGTPAWTREYERRAVICMRIWARQGNRRVYWLSVPPARDSSWAHDDAQINTALRRAAAQVPGAKFVDVLGPVTDHGRYADFVSVNGQVTLVREPDGVHLNIVGSTLVAQQVRAVLAREWHFAQPPRRATARRPSVVRHRRPAGR